MNEFRGLTWTWVLPCGNVALPLRGPCAGWPVLVGFHVASHVFIEASALVCTALTVASATPEAAPRSEQWKPSPKPIGCWGVLATLRPSAERVASLQGSPNITN